MTDHHSSALRTYIVCSGVVLVAAVPSADVLTWTWHCMVAFISPILHIELSTVDLSSTAVVLVVINGPANMGMPLQVAFMPSILHVQVNTIDLPSTGVVLVVMNRPANMDITPQGNFHIIHSPY